MTVFAALGKEPKALYVLVSTTSDATSTPGLISDVVQLLFQVEDVRQTRDQMRCSAYVAWLCDSQSVRYSVKHL